MVDWTVSEQAGSTPRTVSASASVSRCVRARARVCVYVCGGGGGFLSCWGSD